MRNTRLRKISSVTSKRGEKIKSYSILSFIFGPKHFSVSLCHCFLHLSILTMLIGCQFIYVICFNHKKPIQRFSVISMKVILQQLNLSAHSLHLASTILMSRITNKLKETGVRLCFNSDQFFIQTRFNGLRQLMFFFTEIFSDLSLYY